jgi:L-2-hydroxyglutarate oxidase LhgO
MQVRGLIYPVPDPELPFLGVHVTRMVDGRVKVGPTALPAFGREAYETWLDREDPGESVRLVGTHARIAMKSAIVRRHAWAELRQMSRHGTARAAAKLVRGMTVEDLSGISSVGLRAQLVERRTGALVQDFVVEAGESSTHVLNAVSPAFSSALAFAKAVVESIEAGRGGTLGRTP